MLLDGKNRREKMFYYYTFENGKQVVSKNCHMTIIRLRHYTKKYGKLIKVSA